MITLLLILIHLLNPTSETSTYKMIQATYVDVHCLVEGEQFLTIDYPDIYYHGKIKQFGAGDNDPDQFIYFLTKGMARPLKQKAYKMVGFDHFYVSKDIAFDITDYTSNSIEENRNTGPLLAYNSFYGNLYGDTLTLYGTKHLYDSRSDELTFVRVK